MLGLATHEPNFSLLREEIKFTTSERKGRNSRPEEITFHLLHLSVMRDYIHHEFEPLRKAIKEMPPDQEVIKYDLERVIDDWVMMGFLVGNDFVPHLPHMHIRQVQFKISLPYEKSKFCSNIVILLVYFWSKTENRNFHIMKKHFTRANSSGIIFPDFLMLGIWQNI